MSIVLTKDFYRVDMDEYSAPHSIRLVKTDGPDFEANEVLVTIKDSEGTDVSSHFSSYSVPEGEKTEDSLVIQFTVDESVYNPFENYTFTITVAGEQASVTVYFCQSDISAISFVPFRHRATSEVINKPLRELRDCVKHAFCKITELEETAGSALEVYATRESGTFDQTRLGVRLWSNDVNADIYYELTDDGSTPATPGAGSSTYTGEIEMTIAPGTVKTFKLKAIATRSGTLSAVGSWEFVLTDAPLTISIDPACGSYTEPQTITLTPSETATIRYTTDGSIPSPTVGTVYDSQSDIFLSNGVTTLKYIAYTDSGKTSQVYSCEFTISTADLIVYPSLPDGSTYVGDSSTNVTIVIKEAGIDVTDDCTIRYTLDGTDPDPSGTLLSSPYQVPLNTSIAQNQMRIWAVKGTKEVDTTFTYDRYVTQYTEEAYAYSFTPSNAYHFTAGASGTDNIKIYSIRYRTSDGVLHAITGSALDQNFTLEGESCYVAMFINVGAYADDGDISIDYASGYDLAKLTDGNSQVVYAHVEIRKVSDDSVVIAGRTQASQGRSTYYYDTAPSTNLDIDVGIDVTEPAQTSSTYCSADRTLVFSGILLDDGTPGTDVSSDASYVVTYTIEKENTDGTWTDVTSSYGEGDGTFEGGDTAITLAGDTDTRTRFRITVAEGDAVYTGGYANSIDYVTIVTIDKRQNVPVVQPGDTTFSDELIVTIDPLFEGTNAEIYYAFDTEPSGDPGVDPDWISYPPSSGDPGYDPSSNDLLLTGSHTVYAVMTENKDGSDYLCPSTDTTVISKEYTKGSAYLTVYFSEDSGGSNPLGFITKYKAGQSATIYLKTQEGDGSETKKYTSTDDTNDGNVADCYGSGDNQAESDLTCAGQDTILSSGTTPGSGGAITKSSSTAKSVRICGAAQDGTAKGSKFIDIWFSGIREISGDANVEVTGTDIRIRGGKYTYHGGACTCYEWLTGSNDYKYVTIKGIGLTGIVSISEVTPQTGFSLEHTELSVAGDERSICLRLKPTTPKDSAAEAVYRITVGLDVDGDPSATDTFDVTVYGGASSDFGGVEDN
ncbi:MAG: chitobiase/beta-hexosaminidase C-terminal domain-containing protein, partial [Halobacteriota archaeon]|nr:chitobiase/beta-hexosaminidase C-terminal domain-containing protein [Halobacteriota archaeon]